MKPIILALLGSVAAVVAMPGAAYAQTAAQMGNGLVCEPDSPTTTTPPVTTNPTTPATDGGSSGGTGTGGGSSGGSTPVFGPSNPVVQPVPTPDPTPTPTTPVDNPAPVTNPGTGGGGSVGDNVRYVTNGNVAAMRVTSSMHGDTKVNYYRATGVSSAYQQNLLAVKTYPTPSGNGELVTIGGQKILARDGAKLSGLDSHIINIIDEINLTAAALGMPDPVITAGHDQKGHSPTSDHYSGDALDLRCNAVSETACKKWVIGLANALGSGYDVIFEDWNSANSHVHVAWTR